MHELTSVTYEAFYKRKGNGREKDLLFTLLLDGGDYVILSGYKLYLSWWDRVL